MKPWWKYLDKRMNPDRVLGMDEVGRGPLAGPVCVGGVILPKNHGIRGLRDSKMLTAEKRELLYEKIHAKGEVFVEFASNVRIDKEGIAVCIKSLMRKIVKKAQPDLILTDAVSINYPEIMQMAIIKGDDRVDCIAAASIVAKVERDRLMKKLENRYPGYGLGQHKGYGQHREAIMELGMCKIHRKSFIHVHKN